MQTSVIILRLLMIITLMLIVKDVSLYMIIRGNEDTISKQIPSILTESINKSTSKPISGNTNNKFIDVNKRLNLSGTTVISIRKVGNNSTLNNWGFNHIYRDSNNNKVIDTGDVGYVTSGSTIKVLIAYCLYKQETPNSNKQRVIKKALVISDNDSANQMIDWIGGVTKVQKCFNSEGLTNSYINRMFGSSKAITNKGCKEENIYSNCTTPETLIKLMEYLVTGNNSLGLYLPEDKRKQLVRILSLRPKNIGINKPDNYCAFIKEVGPQKCGIALLDTSITNIAYIPNKKIIIFIGYKGSNNLNDNEINKVMSALYTIGLEGSKL